MVKFTSMGFGIARLDTMLDCDAWMRLDCMDCRIAHPCGFSFGALYIILYYYNEYFIKLHRCAILQFMQFFTQIHRFTDSHICVGSIKLHNNIIYYIFIMTKI